MGHGGDPVRYKARGLGEAATGKGMVSPVAPPNERVGGARSRTISTLHTKDSRTFTLKASAAEECSTRTCASSTPSASLDGVLKPVPAPKVL